MTDRLDMIAETEEFELIRKQNENLPTREVPTLLIEDNPEKMKRYYEMQGGNY